MESFSQLLPVIKDIASNETNSTILEYYRKIIFSTNNSIVALNNLVSNPALIQLIFIIITLHSSLQIAGLENRDKEDGEPTTDNGDCTTQVQPSADDTIVRYTLQTYVAPLIILLDIFLYIQGVKTHSETDQCRQLGKAAILSALLGQAILTLQVISQV